MLDNLHTNEEINLRQSKCDSTKEAENTIDRTYEQ